MPHLKSISIRQVYLPSSKDEPIEADRAWVKIKDQLLTAEIVGLSQSTSVKEAYLYGLVELITEWNFTDAETGEPTPIDITTVGRLEPQDFEFLTQTLEEIKADNFGDGLDKGEKKTSSDTLTPEQTAEKQI